MVLPSVLFIYFRLCALSPSMHGDAVLCHGQIYATCGRAWVIDVGVPQWIKPSITS